MQIKASDYIVGQLKEYGINHYFGYQGTMIAHLVDSICKDSDVHNHVCYNEQGAAMAAVGYTKASGAVAVAYATSGPGAINLMSGIADAFYDSVPVVCLVGQLNTNEYTDIPELRQQGFQQTDVVSMFKPICKFVIQVTDAADIPEYIHKAYRIATTGRKGPVVLDIPMNVQRTMIEVEGFEALPEKEEFPKNSFDQIKEALAESKRPLLLLGNGLSKLEADRKLIAKQAMDTNIPIITSMLGRDIIPSDYELNLGFLGAAYGHRAANIISARKADLIIALGCSFCRRQTGLKSEEYAPEATIIRVDVDEVELRRKVHQSEIDIIADAHEALAFIVENGWTVNSEWLDFCKETKHDCEQFDAKVCEGREPNKLVAELSASFPEDAVICSDVGQHQIWCAQSIQIKNNRRLIFSGGHGAMGFAIPAAIGAHYAQGHPTIAICGDGAAQMNIQELQWIVRDQVPVTIIVLNNNSLGLIRQQQDDFFDKKHFGATAEYGFSSPSFAKLAKAYGIDSAEVYSIEDINEVVSNHKFDKPLMIEVIMPGDTKAYPKTYFGEKMFNQRPYLDETIMNRILSNE